jgi:hypothetical protein
MYSPARMSLKNILTFRLVLQYIWLFEGFARRNETIQRCFG